MEHDGAVLMFYFNLPFIAWNLAIFALYLYKSNRQSSKKKQNLKMFQRWSHNICLLCILFTSIGDTVHAYGAIITDSDLLSFDVRWILVVQLLTDVFYYCSSLLLYVILIHRLFSTFMETFYAISQWYFYWILFQLMIQVVFMVLYILAICFDECTTKVGCDRIGTAASIITLNDYVLNIVTLVLFVHTLRKVVVNMASGEVEERIVRHSLSLNRELDESGKDKIVDTLNRNGNMNLLSIITKQTIIGAFITLTNQTFGTCVFIIAVFYAQQALKIAYIAFLIRTVEGAFLSALLYLGLAMNNDHYIAVCKCCHRTCYRVCAKNARDEVEDNYLNKSLAFLNRPVMQ